ncbi:MAG: DUF4131 domain-containing protein, partial [Burkholderiales bacterium]
MRLGILAFAAGVWLLQSQATLPGWPAIAALAAAFAGAVAMQRVAGPGFTAVARVVLLVASLGLGFAWAAAAAKVRLADRLDPAWEGRDVTLTGVVASLPQPFERGVRFELDVEDAVGAGVNAMAFEAPDKVALSWYNALTLEEFQEVLPIRAGERWRLTV